jgi:hypothetical protein
MTAAIGRLVCEIVFVFLASGYAVAEKLIAFVAGIDRYDELDSNQQLQKAADGPRRRKRGVVFGLKE